MILLIPSRRRWGHQTNYCWIIDTLSVKSKIKDKDFSEVEHWLNKQNGTVMIQVFHIQKLFWLYVLIRRDLDDT
jgi:hypothetical protein